MQTNETIKITLPADQELGRVNEALRADLWREAHEAQDELRVQMAAHRAGKRFDQVAFSAVVLLWCAAAGVLLGAWCAWWQW